MNQTLAIVGASSQIARDLLMSMADAGRDRLLLYVRDITETENWVGAQGLSGSCRVLDYSRYGREPHDAVLNFVGVGDPRKAFEMGSSIVEITQQFDELVMRELPKNPDRRYIFMSSGVVYGGSFHQPVDENTRANIDQIGAHDWYALAKMHTEMRHRARAESAIVDLRIFNYFSRTQSLETRFFITDLLRSLREGRTVTVSSDHMVRDYLHPSDFHGLVEAVLAANHTNTPLDCYSQAPVDKREILDVFHDQFGLRYHMVPTSESVAVNATGAKPYYYSLNRQAGALGYSPKHSSIVSLIKESAALLA